MLLPGYWIIFLLSYAGLIILVSLRRLKAICRNRASMVRPLQKAIILLVINLEQIFRKILIIKIKDTTVGVSVNKNLIKKVENVKLNFSTG